MAKLKLTDKLCDEICNDIKAGVPIVHASVAHGISQTTFYDWYNQGKTAKSGAKKKFYDKVNEAKSVAITLRARRIYKAGETSWQADAWWLERVDPDNFGRKDHLNIESKQEIQQTNNINGLIEAFDASKKEWDKHK
jgi:hypothetical protein